MDDLFSIPGEEPSKGCTETRCNEFILEPVQGYFSSYSFAHVYHTQVREILLKNADDNPLARMVELASFSPEHAISLESREDRSFLIRYECSVPIWNNRKLEEIEVAVVQADINQKLSGLIHEIFYCAVSRTSYTEDGPLGLDGATYYFSAYRRNYGLRAGQVWSPREKTIAGSLVAYAYLMGHYVGAAADNRLAIEVALRDQGKALLARLSST